MSLLISLRAEALKTRRTASLYLTLVAAAFVPVIFLMDLLSDGISPEGTKTIFNKMFKEGFSITGFAIFPMFVMLICTLLAQIEYKNNAWKQVLTSPQTKLNVFVAKFLSIHSLIFVFLLANQVFMLILAAVLHVAHPSWNILGQPINVYAILVNIVNSYVCVLAIGALHFWLGLIFKNFIIPVAIGVALWFLGSMLVLEYNSTIAPYFPYSFQVYPLFPKQRPKLNSVEWTSVGYTALFLVLGFLDFRRGRIRS